MITVFKKLPKILASALFVTCTLILISSLAVASTLPASFNVTNGDDLRLSSSLPVTVRTLRESRTLDNPKLETGDCYDVSLNLFGVIPIKKASVKVVDTPYVYLGGQPFGIKLFTNGVIVVSLSSVDSNGESTSPAKDAGLKIGDNILAVDGKTVSSNGELANLIGQSQGKSLKLTVKRGNVTLCIEFRPAKSDTGTGYKAGIFVRDSSAGIGTLTFVDAQRGVYAGLGHGICDVDTGKLMPVMAGEIFNAGISAITPSQKGKPGEIKGRFISNAVGSLLVNCECGVFGNYTGNTDFDVSPVPVMLPQQVKTGSAKIVCSVSGEVKHYDCVIEKSSYNPGGVGHDMVIRVTDKRLLETTGGIVQGMSGSPIVQNGMLAGAVTHVFVNEPECGYGVFARTMLEKSYSVSSRSDLKKAS